jgi:hypothetical protein
MSSSLHGIERGGGGGGGLLTGGEVRGSGW